MSGDWIKFDVSTFDKPEVIMMADRLQMPESHVVGCLLQVWAWFDQHTEDGNASSVTTLFIDRRTGVNGFGEAMLSAGWLVVIRDEKTGKEAGLSMPGFEIHNGKSAKKRALTARRVAKYKANAELTQEALASALPREEKRRYKKRIPLVSQKKTEPTQEFLDAWAQYPKRAGGNSRADAWKAWQARIKAGATTADLTAGAARYRAFCDATGKTGTEFVKQGSTFYGPSEHFREPWEIPPDGTRPRENQTRAERHQDKLREIAERSLAEERRREADAGGHR